MSANRERIRKVCELFSLYINKKVITKVGAPSTKKKKSKASHKCDTFSLWAFFGNKEPLNIPHKIIFKNHLVTGENTSEAFSPISAYHGNGYPHVKGQLQCRVALVQMQVQIIYKF